MKLELKNETNYKTKLDEVYAFRLEMGTGFIAEDNQFFVLWWDGDNYPTVYPIKDKSMDQELFDCLVSSNVVENISEIIKTYTEDEFELIFKEI